MRTAGPITGRLEGEARVRFREWMRKEPLLIHLLAVLEDRAWPDPHHHAPPIARLLSPDDLRELKAEIIRRVRRYPDGVARLSHLTCRIVAGELKLELPT